jgi:hypothetical protein
MKRCIVCSKEFLSNYPHAKFCSIECRQTPCEVCGTLIDNPRRDRKTCSVKCKGEIQKVSLLGKNNPNFGKKWPDEKRQERSLKMLDKSEAISERVRLDWEKNAKRREEQSDRAKIFLRVADEKSSPMFGKTHTTESKIIIGAKSKSKFTTEFKKKFRKKMEEGGNWIPENEKSDYEIYFKESNWMARMFDIIPNGIELINEHGIFHAKTNPKGVVRDHIVGRSHGFKSGVFPEIIRHPANCSIISHGENVSKGQRGEGRRDAGMTIEDLFKKILGYEDEWIEQEVCINLISAYNSGIKWKRSGDHKNGDNNDQSRKEAKCKSDKK